MRQIKLQLILALVLLRAVAIGQGLPVNEIAVGSGTGITSSPQLKYKDGELTIGSIADNYLTFQNGVTGYFGFDQYGKFAWWTPGNGGTKKMVLATEGALKLGDFFIQGNNAPPSPGINYKLMVDGGAYFTNQLYAAREMTDATTAVSGGGNASFNAYRLLDNVTTGGHHFAQSNSLVASNTNGNTPSGATLTAYQSAAQQNEVYLFKETYTAYNGPGETMSVQTNSFYPDAGSTASRFINTYIRTHLGSGNNSIGTYYSLFIEAPFGQGTTAQIGDYYGMYQESADAKNFFAGKVWVGAKPSSGSLASDAQLAVNGNVYCSKLKVTQTGWADFVFDAGYKLPALAEVETFIKANKHLPGVVSAKEVEEKGNDVGKNEAVLLQKVEELTLYMIETNKKLELLQRENESMKKKLDGIHQ